MKYRAFLIFAFGLMICMGALSIERHAEARVGIQFQCHTQGDALDEVRLTFGDQEAQVEIDSMDGETARYSASLTQENGDRSYFVGTSSKSANYGGGISNAILVVITGETDIVLARDGIVYNLNCKQVR